MTRRVIVPRAAVVPEIAFAIAYTRACNPDRDLLGEDRELLAAAIADMLAERAGAGKSGMRIEDSGGAEETKVTRPGWHQFINRA